MFIDSDAAMAYFDLNYKPSSRSFRRFDPQLKV